ncbi:kinesin family plus-end directed microtubule motor Tea2 [Schizosaccharomyces pombe]|uniref:Kinesin-like protein tea2 n=1 Tax=Schizosaccharomyces pombe (strain 972 / ATCC 24843) TaxID=284812 RepID=TEA2_SCHPO|nr:kinesin-like protein Tea2 [Schizosaccharomyces pombe]Q1MTQ1.1 RecName: Full=Kinesin-like protein tea2; AltName: Full=Kinesin-like protein 4; AltName: Full=Tip elongation aberrant protein 2 [Schizosaccharomyces pombe 972h-]CAA22353.1 kinesin-like protein Tea2 [Schizosaccharomyces pombe]|eukprot:NP_596620.1 kinesin-like protein Tea2 [Schizosaccharomyces pombe]
MSSSSSKPVNTGLVTPRRYSTMTGIRTGPSQSGTGSIPYSPTSPLSRNFSNYSIPMLRSNSTQTNVNGPTAFDLGVTEKLMSPGTLDRYTRPALYPSKDLDYLKNEYVNYESTTSQQTNSKGLKESNFVGSGIITSIRIRPIGKNQGVWSHGKLSNDPYGREYIRQQTSTSSSTIQQEYLFNNVFGMESKNYDIYKRSVKSVVRNVFSGYNGIVFAYGMTGTGKTYSMQGTENEPGIIPLAMNDLFEMVENNSDDDTFQIRISYLEIYNERIRDLIGNSDEEPRIRENASGEVNVTPLTRVLVTSPEEVSQVIEQCNAIRKTAATDFNTYSSRSHAILQVFLIRNNPTAHTSQISSLSLVDLAGSERASAHHERRKEGAFINKSLLTLGTVISRLSAAANPSLTSNSGHIPYRESKLTRLLQQSLSGQSQISLLATISIESNHTMETTNTLKFASRAQNLPQDIRQAEAVTNVQAELASLHSALEKNAQEVEYYASLVKQLTSDLEERDTYIAMLEAERSQGTAISRARLRMEELLSDHNFEIADLRDELQDKEQIIYALRYAQKQRDIADFNQSLAKFPHKILKKNVTRGSRSSSDQFSNETKTEILPDDQQQSKKDSVTQETQLLS